MGDSDYACVNPEAMQHDKEKSLGYKALSKRNTPLLVSPDIIFDSSLHDRDVMLHVFATLIAEN